MRHRCFVKNCKSGHKGCKETVSTFKAPDDPQQLEAWATAIGGDRKLTSKHYICEKHFASDMIKRDKYYGDLGGEVLLDHPKRPKLLPEAVPRRRLFCPPAPKKKRPHRGPSAGDSYRNTKTTKSSMHDQPTTSASGSTSAASSGLQVDVASAGLARRPHILH
ncbi:hypothetical protein HPB48_007806 [Haemaphysalis longicornis]|uniref:THAP-type domain-containing protein n=1 Tax=Haemaphysalis longicornis TaxID=44386 RepID=A0A9J6FN87_HAELO|nr:hypothetical protein HPB48_007806 [Haemaphysalis longicornis]